MDGRSGASGEYRYGFQGQEMDDEVKGEGNSINYKYRMHDARIGRFFAVDPLAPKYPWYTPYSFSGNIVINAIELEGLEQYFTFSGEFIGALGTSPEVRILNSGVLKESAELMMKWVVSDIDPTATDYLLELEKSSKHFDGQNHTNAISGVFAYYYDEIGGDPKGAIINRERSFSPYSSGIAGTQGGKGYGLEPNEFKISIGAPFIGDGIITDSELLDHKTGEYIINMYDIENLLVHERDHGRLFAIYSLDNPNWDYVDDYQKNNWVIYHQFESEATWAQLKHESWANTSLEFKKAIWDNGYGPAYVTDKADIKKYFENYGVDTSKK